MGRVLIILVLLVVLIGAGMLYFFSRPKPALAPTTPTAGQVTTSPTAPTGITSATQTQNTVTLTQTGFAPATLTIKAGQTVTWINKSGMAATVNSDPHPV